MKKFISYILIIFTAASTLAFVDSGTVYAEDTFKAPIINKPSLLPGPDKDQVKDEGSRKILTESVLPKFAIRFISLIGAISLLFIVIGGVRYTMVYNNDEAAEKAKNQITYAIVGFLVAILSYTIVTIVTNLDFAGEPTSMRLIPTAYATKISPENIDELLLPRPGEKYDGAEDEDDGSTTKPFYDELSAVQGLPEVTDQEVITSAIKTILGAASLLAIIAVCVAGLYYLIARGDEEKVTKAKNILVYLIIGMVVISASYAVVSGIAQFDFLSTR